ncbi:MAG: OmpA family protein [Thermodesulfobacteriota bacterium]
MNKHSNSWYRYLLAAVLGVFIVMGISSTYVHAVSNGQEPGSGLSGAASSSDSALPNPYIPELKDVFFDPGSFEIRDDAKPVLDENVSVLKESPDIDVVIEAYCSAGENSADTLGADRADSIKKYFIDMGIDPDRIITADGCRDSAKQVASGTDDLGLESRVNFIPMDRVLDKDSFALNACCRDSGRKGLIN